MNLGRLQKRLYKVGFVTVALGLLSLISVEIWHRSENTHEKRMSRGFSKSGFSSTLEAFIMADELKSKYIPYEDDIRGDYIKYPIILLGVSGAFFLAAYLIGDPSGKKETALE
jgi:hypothetical protein